MTKVVCALSIAGSDSGGGAGIQADLKTFAALGVHGMTAITSITAQNTMEVTAIQDVAPPIVRAQIKAVVSDIGVDAAKTGMLHSSDIIEIVVEQIEKHGDESFGAVTSEGKLIGYLIAETVVYIYGTDDLSAWIILLGVDPKYQDQGIGTALVKQALNYFNQKGIKKIRTICAWNWGDLVEFFSSVGFNLSTYLTLELDLGS